VWLSSNTYGTHRSEFSTGVCWFQFVWFSILGANFRSFMEFHHIVLMSIHILVLRNTKCRSSRKNRSRSDQSVFWVNFFVTILLTCNIHSDARKKKNDRPTIDWNMAYTNCEASQCQLPVMRRKGKEAVTQHIDDSASTRKKNIEWCIFIKVSRAIRAHDSMRRERLKRGSPTALSARDTQEWPYTINVKQTSLWMKHS